MASPTEPPTTSAHPLPSIASPTPHPDSHPDSHSSSSASSDSEHGHGREGRSTLARPKPSGRQPSGTNIIPRDHPRVELSESDEHFAPDDARTMSPRRNSEDVDRLSREARRSLQANAQSLQSSLAALADRIDSVRVEHDKLESENKFLQDYIGGLTRTMSRNELVSGKGKK